MTTEDESRENENIVRVDFGRKSSKRAPTPRSTPLAKDLPAEAPEKLRVFARLIERGMVMTTLDARVEGVCVPAKFVGDLQLNLNFSHRFGVPDFAYDDVGVRCTLSFGGQPFLCDVPWSAIYVMRSHVDNEVVLWPEHLPTELVARLPPEARPPGTRPVDESAGTQPLHPVVLDAEPPTAKDSDDGEPPEPREPPEPARPPGGGLRLVKG